MSKKLDTHINYDFVYQNNDNTLSDLQLLLRSQMYSSNFFSYNNRSFRMNNIGYTLKSVQHFDILNKDLKISHNGCINSTKWNKNGSRMITGSDDRCIKIWDTSSGDYNNTPLLHRIKSNHSSNIFCADFAPYDQSVCISCAADGSLYYHDINSKHAQLQLYTSSSIMHMFMFDIDNCNIIYTAEESGEINRIDMRTKKHTLLYINRLFNGNTSSSVRALAQSPFLGSNQMIIGGSGLSIPMIDLRLVTKPDGSKCLSKVYSPLFSTPGYTEQNLSAVTTSLRAKYHGDVVSVSGLQVSSDGTTLLASYQGDQIYTFSINGYGNYQSLPTSKVCNSHIEEHYLLDDGVSVVGANRIIGGHVNYATFLKTVSFFGPKDDYIVGGSDSGFVYIWDASSGAIIGIDDPSDRTCVVVNKLFSDNRISNGVIPHPTQPILASYGTIAFTYIFVYLYIH